MKKLFFITNLIRGFEIIILLFFGIFLYILFQPVRQLFPLDTSLVNSSLPQITSAPFSKHEYDSIAVSAEEKIKAAQNFSPLTLKNPFVSDNLTTNPTPLDVE